LAHAFTAEAAETAEKPDHRVRFLRSHL